METLYWCIGSGREVARQACPPPGISFRRHLAESPKPRGADTRGGALLEIVPTPVPNLFQVTTDVTYCICSLVPTVPSVLCLRKILHSRHTI
jgi:hypothetical protein